MRIRAVAAVVVLEDGSRWGVTMAGREGGVAQLVAMPGYLDPEPVELAPGLQVMPPSTLDGTWAVAVSDVGPVTMRRLEAPAPDAPPAPRGVRSGAGRRW